MASNPPWKAEEEGRTTLATRIPQPLHRKLKLFCVQHDFLLKDCITAALAEKLRKREMRKAAR